MAVSRFITAVKLFESKPTRSNPLSNSQTNSCEKELDKRERNIGSPKRQSGEGSITLVTIDAFHRRTPEVVVEHAAPGRLADHVPVPHHRRYVVVHEVAVERIEITADRDERDRRVDAPPRWLVRLSLVASAAAAFLHRRRLAEATVVPSPHAAWRCSVPRTRKALTFVRPRALS